MKRVYPAVSLVLRSVTGWVSFSVGDCLYVLTAIWVLKQIVQTVIFFIKTGITWQKLAFVVFSVVRSLAKLYIFFMVLWGFNYSREGIAAELKLSDKEYSKEELSSLTAELLQKVNTTRLALGNGPVQYPSADTMYKEAVKAYGAVAEQYPFLAYQHASIKSSLFSTVITCLGYTGYYNPFSGEAQVSAKVPPYYTPFITCHEMAHQLGYGDESEANFIGYLSARASGNPVFLYSTYYDLFNYANSELFMRDSMLARSNFRALDTLVKQDIRYARKYFNQYKSRMEPVVKFLYGEYLKANNMPQGIDTYEAVTAWLIAYRKKYGAL
ncbi:hypothetical protein FLA_1613 [Filimonas lacunae]|nr:hypothetical protein FLA_1613 [Filimonas lacunae]